MWDIEADVGSDWVKISLLCVLSPWLAVLMTKLRVRKWELLFSFWKKISLSSIRKLFIGDGRPHQMGQHDHQRFLISSNATKCNKITPAQRNNHLVYTYFLVDGKPSGLFISFWSMHHMLRCVYSIQGFKIKGVDILNKSGTPVNDYRDGTQHLYCRGERLSSYFSKIFWVLTSIKEEK